MLRRTCAPSVARSVPDRYIREREREREKETLCRAARGIFSLLLTARGRLFLGSEHIGAAIPLVASVGGKCTLRRVCTIRFKRSSRKDRSRGVNSSLALEMHNSIFSERRADIKRVVISSPLLPLLVLNKMLIM